MKKILLPILFFCVINAYSQDIPEVKRIDSLVMVINKSDFKVQHDTLRLFATAMLTRDAENVCRKK